MRNSYIGQAWLVLTLALCFGAALAGVETWLRPRIEANKLAATLDQIPVLVRGADAAASERVKPLVITVGEGTTQSQYDVFRAVAADGRQVGWVVKASGKGFADKIELLIGLDLQTETITGLSVLDQKETPGLGNKIEDLGDDQAKGFLWQFFHHSPMAGSPLVVTTASPSMEETQKIKAVAGATISSRSVCDIVNEALSAELRQKLLFELPAEPEATGAATTTRPARE